MAPDFVAAYHYLQQARKFGLKLGLETMESLVAALGHPERHGQFIHIAGTNGKGSTAAFCASVLQEAGYRVGLYTSPHLCSLRERIRVQGAMITPMDFTQGIQHIQHLASDRGLNPTFFEILSGLALWHFGQQKVDWVIWETGLGGRLDATNVVTPVVSIITNIALDHTQYLGSTLEAIAREKAGIIKPGVPLVAGFSEREPWAVIEEVANERRAPLIQIGRDQSFAVLSDRLEGLRVKIEQHEFTLGLLGLHQARNAACAYAALQSIRLRGKATISIEALQRGLARTQWPGRLQLIRDQPPFVLDGAHNEDAAGVLQKSWEDLFGDLRYHLVFGALQDKPFEAMAQVLKKSAVRVTLIGVPSERSIAPESLRPAFADRPVQVYDDLPKIWPELFREPEPTLLAGSLFLVGQALSLARPEEYALDEWALNEKL